MVGISMPSEEALPPGPRRDLVTALHELYELAGKPACRMISLRIRDRGDLPGTLSHEGVSAVLRGVNGAVPRWPNLESLVRVLAEAAIIELSVDTEVVRIHSLWRIAARSPCQIKYGDAVAPNPGSEDTCPPVLTKPLGAVEGPFSTEVESPKKPAVPLASWDHPRFGRFEFFDRDLTPEVIREVGRLDE